MAFSGMVAKLFEHIAINAVRSNIIFFIISVSNVVTNYKVTHFRRYTAHIAEISCLFHGDTVAVVLR